MTIKYHFLGHHLSSLVSFSWVQNGLRQVLPWLEIRLEEFSLLQNRIVHDAPGSHWNHKNVAAGCYISLCGFACIVELFGIVVWVCVPITGWRMFLICCRVITSIDEVVLCMRLVLFPTPSYVGLYISYGKEWGRRHLYRVDIC